MKTSPRLFSYCVAAIAAVTVSGNADASMIACNTNADSRIVNVFFNHSDWNSETDPDGYVGIEVFHPGEGPNGEGTVSRYSTYGFANSEFQHARVLLQLANAAMLSQDGVIIYIRDNKSCTPSNGYIKDWAGIYINRKHKDY